MTAFVAADRRTYLAAASGGEVVRIWDPERAREVTPPLLNPGEVRTVSAFTSPAGQALLAVGTHEGVVRIWDLAKHSPLLDIPVQDFVTEVVPVIGGLVVATEAGVLVVKPRFMAPTA